MRQKFEEEAEGLKQLPIGGGGEHRLRILVLLKQDPTNGLSVYLFCVCMCTSVFVSGRAHVETTGSYQVSSLNHSSA